MTINPQLQTRGAKAWKPIDALATLVKAQGGTKAEVYRELEKLTGRNFKALKDGCGATDTGEPRIQAIEAVEKASKRLKVTYRFV
jgi:hypothetical protein